MIQVISPNNEIINDFPTLTAVAFACDGLTMKELYQLTFLDTRRNRYVSWSAVEAEQKRLRGKRGFASGRVVDGRVVIWEARK